MLLTLLSFYPLVDRLRGFLSIDIDVSELYINQCDILLNSNQFFSEIHYSSSRHNKFPSNQDHQQQFSTNPFANPQLVLLQPPPLTFHFDNEIEAFHGSHKCHRDSMDVRKIMF